MDNIDTKINNNTMSRSNRNSKLYREISNKYQDLDNLPLEDNTDEIDIDSLKKLLETDEKKTRTHRNDIDIDIIKSKRRNNEKEHDINKLLEKAKYENQKIKEPENHSITYNSRSILETLGTNNYEGNYLKKEETIKKEPENIEIPNKLEMTREMKNLTRNLSLNPLTDQVMPNNDLSLDLLSDLKPTENTIVTEPIKEKEEKDTTPKKPEFKKINLESTNTLKNTKKYETVSKQKPFFPMNTEDTSDIDIIKIPEKSNDTKDLKKVDNDFFTSSYEFSRKDFTDYDEEDGKSSSIIKIILLILAILAFGGAIAYFVLNYGINR